MYIIITEKWWGGESVNMSHSKKVGMAYIEQLCHVIFYWKTNGEGGIVNKKINEWINRVSNINEIKVSYGHFEEGGCK